MFIYNKDASQHELLLLSAHFTRSVDCHCGVSPRNTVDERMLRLRQKRGELDASQDGDAPSADDVGAGAGDTAFAKADLDVLFGVTE